ncbi:MAG TPA: hypothetical protein DDW90_04140 [Cyanobacteria bacterium UBA9971]|nr:hypothetical protein [Cyanobacteria bacterium UBA9971]
MQINSVNSPAFGCGACAAAKKKVIKLAEFPFTKESQSIKPLCPDPSKKPETPIGYVRRAIKQFRETHEGSHTEIATSYNRFLKWHLQLIEKPFAN